MVSLPLVGLESQPEQYVSRNSMEALDWALPRDLTIQCRFVRYLKSLEDGTEKLTVSYRYKGEKEYQTRTVDGRFYDFLPGVRLTTLDQGFEFRVDRDEQWTLEFPFDLVHWQSIGDGFMEFGEGHITQLAIHNS